MTDAAFTVPANLLQAPPAAPVASGAPMGASEAAKRAAIHKTATDFEASFLSQMFNHMFDGVETEAPFGGGEGEKMFKSFLVEAFAKQTAKAGGVGLAASVQKEMLKMQGLN